MNVKLQLMEFERLFAGFCQAAQECIKGFQQQELMITNREKATVKIDQKVGVLREYLGVSRVESNNEINSGVTNKLGLGITNLTRDVAREEVQSIISDGEISLDDLKSMIPDGVENTFLSSIELQKDKSMYLS